MVLFDSTISKSGERKPPRLAIVYRSLDLSSDNPRIHSYRQIRQIARSIEAFGFIVPSLVDHKMRVVAGHHAGRSIEQVWSGLFSAPDDPA
jgi:hypothetical protein